MFQFPRLPSSRLCVQRWIAGNDPRWVCPFGDPRVRGYVPLTAAYRSLSRPSSASCAKASTVCPYHLLLDGSNILALRRSRAGLRSDAIFIEENRYCHAMQLSRYGEGRALETGY